MDSKEFKECIEEIFKWFSSETFILLDSVLTDDKENPEFSANTVLANLENMVSFERLYYGREYDSISDYLLKNHYKQEDIDDLLRLQQVELEENKNNYGTSSS